MLYSLTVPGPIEDVEEVRVLEWHVGPGEPIEIGAMIVELETYKALVEVRAGQRGVLRQILCAAGDWQDVGKPIALLSDDAAEPLSASGASLPLLAVAFEVC